jgi:hypothetical protein
LPIANDDDKQHTQETSFDIDSMSSIVFDEEYSTRERTESSSLKSIVDDTVDAHVRTSSFECVDRKFLPNNNDPIELIVDQ